MLFAPTFPPWRQLKVHTKRKNKLKQLNYAIFISFSCHFTLVHFVRSVGTLTSTVYCCDCFRRR